VSDVAWELAVSSEMLWKHSHSNVRRIGNKVVGGPMATCNTVRESQVVSTACIGELLSYLHRGDKKVKISRTKRGLKGMIVPGVTGYEKRAL